MSIICLSSTRALLLLAMNDGTVTERAEGEHDKGKEVILPPRQRATKRMNDCACNDDAGENEKRVLPKNKKQRVDTREEETKKAILLLRKVWMSRSKRLAEENNTTSTCPGLPQQPFDDSTSILNVHIDMYDVQPVFQGLSVNPLLPHSQPIDRIINPSTVNLKRTQYQLSKRFDQNEWHQFIQ